VRTPYKGWPETAKRVEVRRGQSTSLILQQLRKAGVLRDQWIPLVYMKLLRGRDSLKAGVYEFDRAMSPIDVIEKLVRGDVVLKTITVREGLDRFAIAKIFAAEGLGTRSSGVRRPMTPISCRTSPPRRARSRDISSPTPTNSIPALPHRRS
jgi:cell division protein YceG involved in septum cleavage